MAFPSSASATTPANSTDAATLARIQARASENYRDAAMAPNLPAVGAVSWSAIFAGAAAASALSLILLILGTGLGLSSVSPWARAGMGAAAFGVSTILWLTCTQVVASGMGGYLAGRLRVKYVAVHNDEVYFRDTAHGFLTWAIATLLTASVLASAVGGIVGVGASAAGGAAATTAASAVVSNGGVSGGTGGGTSGDTSVGTSVGTSFGTSADITSDPIGYLMDAMFRKSSTGAPVAADVSAGAGAGAGAGARAAASTAEITRVFINGLKQGALLPEDAKYAAAVVASRTGVAPDEAQSRVKATFDRMQTQLRNAEASAKQAADTARKAAAYGALWLFVSLLIGAFFASWAATWGGRHRDL